MPLSGCRMGGAQRRPIGSSIEQAVKEAARRAQEMYRKTFGKEFQRTVGR
jgi:hypothetical protein